MKNSKKFFMKTILSNEITVYEDKKTMKKIIAITKKISQMWNFIFKMINFSSKRWMKIKINENFSKFAKVFRISSKNKTFIDKKFDVLHIQNKIKWSTKLTSYVFSVFVVWHTMHLQNKASLRKNRMIVDIKKFNKIFKFDAYFMFLQSDIISCLQKCKFISIMNCASFFHQWRIAEEDKHKLTMIIHKKAEQWNITVMNWKNSPAYVQREMNEILRNYSFAKTYIDDVIIFSNTLKKHLNHLNQIFSFFDKWNITLKASKTYFEYFIVILLKQKMNSFDLIISAKKFKIIIDLFFSKTLKTLKIYFKIIEYLRNYIFYYAQKSNVLNQRKTVLLRNESNKKNVKKSFSVKILIKNSNQNEINSYE